MTKKKTLGAVFAVLACYLAFVVVAVVVDTKDSRQSSTSQNGSASGTAGDKTKGGDVGRVREERHYPGEEEFKAGMALFEAGDKDAAIEHFVAAAEQGNPVAKYRLGLCFLNAEGVEEDLTEARFWFRKAAELGYAEGQYELGNCYFNGIDVEKNRIEAVKWYTKAAEQGLADAQYALGHYYDQYPLRFSDRTAAREWYRATGKLSGSPANRGLFPSCFTVDCFPCIRAFA